MKKEIVISEADNLAVVIEDGRAVEFFLRQGEQLVGDILLGQVESVAQGIEAAFVNIGQDRNGFIHMSDLPAAQGPRKRLKNAFVRPKEQLLVQIAKAPTGSKGARLTGRISIPGRFVVFVSHDNRVNISRRITNPQERDRLRQLTHRLKDPGHGLIIRTEAEGASEEDLKKDIDELIAAWSDILHQAQLNRPPILLYRDQDLLTRVLREAVSHDTTHIVVDSQSALLRAKAVLQNWMPEMARSVVLHRGPQSIMKQFNLDRELKSALQPKVHLPSGGSLVIESTEALTVVDVNSGRLVGSRNLAETVLRTNLEAASELARQLRLRDIGGVVVVDFISMDHASDQQKILNHLHEAMKPDKARPQIGAMFSEHGLLEISRRRQGQNLLEQLTSPCPHCKGVGRVRNEVLVSTETSKIAEIIEIAEKTEAAEIADFNEVTELAAFPEIAEIPETAAPEGFEELEEEETAEAAPAAEVVKKRRRRRRSRRPKEAAIETPIAVEEGADSLELTMPEEMAESFEEAETMEPEALAEPEAEAIVPEAETMTTDSLVEPTIPAEALAMEPEAEVEVQAEPEKRSRRPRRRPRKDKENQENIESVEKAEAPPEEEPQAPAETVEAIETIETVESEAEPAETKKKRPARRRSPRKPKAKENQENQENTEVQGTPEGSTMAVETV